MQCPACHIENQTGQKFCGSCGQKMDKDCAACGTANPPDYRFCGQCGHNLGASGTIALVRSGLVAEVDPLASALIGHQKEDMQGKPFSLFVTREDLAVFFSHWNTLMTSGKNQVLELALNHKKGIKKYVMVECFYEKSPSPLTQLIHLNFNDITDRRLALDQFQHQQELLNLIYSLADNVHNVSVQHTKTTLVDALKKICLFSKADRSFIYGINEKQNRIERLYQWCQPSSAVAGSKSKSVPLAMIKRSILRLKRERSYITDNTSKLPPSERYELLAWHHADIGALVCHLIYRRNLPIAMIGLARNQSGEAWPGDCVALVKLFGQLVSDLLPFCPPHQRPTDSTDKQNTNGFNQSASHRTSKDETGCAPLLEVADIDQTESPEEGAPPEPKRQGAEPLADSAQAMQIDKLTDSAIAEQQTVHPRDDGLVLLTCPFCGLQESFSLTPFNELGNAVQIRCTCNKEFAAFLEKRRAYRKNVQIEGYFTIAGEYGPNDTKGSIWGPMVIKNISKTGLRFISKRIDLIRPGDDLMVRFNLDNSNRALIHKKVQVVTMNDKEVGCQFKGVDQYDITLGFYFI